MQSEIFVNENLQAYLDGLTVAELGELSARAAAELSRRRGRRAERMTTDILAAARKAGLSQNELSILFGR